MSERPYVKVYREIIDDPRFETIYPSNRNLATWLRMLLSADAMYPAPAPLAGHGRHEVEALCAPECGLIELAGPRSFRLHGLKTERMMQSDAGRAGAAARWGGMAPASDPTWGAMPTNPTEPNPTETNPAEALIEPALDAYQRISPTVSAPALRFLDELIVEFGQEPTARAIGQASLKGRDKLLSRAKTILVVDARNAERAGADARLARRVADKPKPPPEETPEQREVREAKWAEVQAQLKQIGIVHPKETK